MNKKTLLSFLIVSLVSAAGALLWAQTGPTANMTGDNPVTDQKMVLVATLNSIEANQEFQRNVQVMQAQRKSLVDLQAALNTATSETQRQALQQAINEATAKINADNQLMVDTYGFSLSRNYALIVETAHIYMFVSEEEAARIEAERGTGTPSR